MSLSVRNAPEYSGLEDDMAFIGGVGVNWHPRWNI
jgi:hypothetical protein